MNKKALLVFDGMPDMAGIKKALSTVACGEVDLFPLTSEYRILHSVRSGLAGEGQAGFKVGIMESAKVIDREVDVLRGNISRWSADLGDHEVDGRSLKRWFELPGGEVSTWWFSALSEKNTLKNETFFTIAQVEAINDVFKTERFGLCVISVSSPSLAAALRDLCERHGIAPELVNGSGNRSRLSSMGDSILFSIIKALPSLRDYIVRSVMARIRLGSVRPRAKNERGAILFVSYFPNVDNELAKKGKLKNKYIPYLQDMISEKGKRIIWIWMCDPKCEGGFPYLMRLSDSFSKNGERNCFLEEFASFGLYVKTICLWLRQIAVVSRLRRRISRGDLSRGLSVPESEIFIKNMMIDSFAGWTGLEGILLFGIFKEIFGTFHDSSRVIYYLEMHAWEKALNAAKRAVAGDIESVGFQHASIPPNFFHYFHHPREIASRDLLASVPLPEVVACNGDLPADLMKRCGYPAVKRVEAIRHLYLAKHLKKSGFVSKERVVMIAGSINKRETMALMSIFYEAFPKPEEFRVWLKGHPAMPFDGILKELDIDIAGTHYSITDEPTERLLGPVKTLFVGSSSLAIEALASGCDIIIPMLSDCMFMSPLKGFEQYYRQIGTPDELKEAVLESIGNDKAPDVKGKLFVSRYWQLDDSLQGWARVLHL